MTTTAWFFISLGAAAFVATVFRPLAVLTQGLFGVRKPVIARLSGVDLIVSRVSVVGMWAVYFTFAMWSQIDSDGFEQSLTSNRIVWLACLVPIGMVAVEVFHYCRTRMTTVRGLWGVHKQTLLCSFGMHGSDSCPSCPHCGEDRRHLPLSSEPDYYSSLRGTGVDHTGNPWD